MSRLQNEKTEWILSPIFYQKILEVFNCKPEIDRFASCINYHIGQYVSWHPNRSSYRKSQAGEAFGDHDYTMVEKTGFVSHEVSLLKYLPILFSPNLLTSPSKRLAKHPLYLEMKLLAVHLSGKLGKSKPSNRN